LGASSKIVPKNNAAAKKQTQKAWTTVLGQRQIAKNNTGSNAILSKGDAKI